MIRGEINNSKPARANSANSDARGGVFALLGVILLLRHRPAAPYFLIRARC